MQAGAHPKNQTFQLLLNTNFISDQNKSWRLNKTIYYSKILFCQWKYKIRFFIISGNCCDIHTCR
jgi:hypothetical protein